MRRTYSLYPKNKISTSTAMFQLPLKNISFSSEKNYINESVSRTAIPKSKKIRKLIEEINLTNPKPTKNANEPNNLYYYQKLLREEKLKNKNYSENIILLTKHIEELESIIKNNNNKVCQNNNINDELNKLRIENQELKIFKEKVYKISIKYDEINKDILDCLKSIENIVQIYNMNNNCNMEYKYDNLNNISQNFKSIINDITNFMVLKQEEYNTLLNEKENEIQKLKNGLNCSNYTNTNLFSNSNEINSYTNKGITSNKSYEFLNCNRTNKIEGRNKINNFCKNCKYIGFDFDKNKKKYEVKSAFNDF